ncbi:MAG TPA: hypothetical protein V6C85_20295 [Allocoleopsis sp.]
MTKVMDMRATSDMAILSCIKYNQSQWYFLSSLDIFDEKTHHRSLSCYCH